MVDSTAAGTASGAPPWFEAEWWDRASAWITNELDRLGRPPTGPIETIHQRPWSAFARVPTAQGTVYFKASAPALRFEGPLTQALAESHPDVSAPFLSMDARRGWTLVAHVGDSLRSKIQSPEDLPLWHPILRRYVELQIELAPRVPEFLAFGAPDRRLERLPQAFEALLHAEESLRLGRAGGLSLEEHQRLLALRPQFAVDCQELAAFSLPTTLVHEEVHDANVLVRPGGGPVFVDWGDSSVGHPFFSVLVMLRHAAYRQNIPESDPAIQRLQEVYLEGWTSFGSIAELRRAASIAYRLAMVVRSLAYEAVFGPLRESFRIENDSTSGWLQEFLQAEASAG
ncbi:MAG TPA: phosphotransferase [Anaerolineales bacterium]|nr:phosphotransferase [Anaerolineales bacterium]